MAVIPDWDATAYHNGTSYCLVLSTQPSPISVNGIETDKSHRIWTLWNDQDCQGQNYREQKSRVINRIILQNRVIYYFGE